MRQPRDHTKQRYLWPYIQTHLLLQPLFADRLAGQILRAEVSGEIPIRAGVPHILVNAIENAHQVSAAMVHDLVQPCATILGSNLIGVARRYGGHHSRVVAAALERVHAAKVFDRVRAKLMLWDTHLGQRLTSKLRLMSHVVNGQHTRRLGELATRLGPIE